MDSNTHDTTNNNNDASINKNTTGAVRTELVIVVVAVTDRTNIVLSLRNGNTKNEWDMMWVTTVVVIAATTVNVGLDSDPNTNEN